MNSLNDFDSAILFVGLVTITMITATMIIIIKVVSHTNSILDKQEDNAKLAYNKYLDK